MTDLADRFIVVHAGQCPRKRVPLYRLYDRQKRQPLMTTYVQESEAQAFAKRKNAERTLPSVIRTAGLVLACLLALCGAALAAPTIGGPSSPDQKAEIATDLPSEQRMRNTVGTDGAGLCVFTSIEHSGRWANEERLRGFQKAMTRETGGGYPAKVDKMMQRHAPGVRYVQYEGDKADILAAAIAAGRMPSVTYNGRDPFYGSNRRIAHMVNLVAWDAKANWAAVMDNNHPRDLVWMRCDEFLSRWRGGGAGWCVILLNPPPPPPPKN